MNYDKFSLPQFFFLAAITTEKEQSYFHEAVKDERWIKSMQEEIQALEANKTWEVQSLPSGRKAFDCKWVYRIKYRSDGTI